MTNKFRISPIIGLFFGILAVSTASLFIRFAQQEAPSLVVAVGRMLIAAVILLPFALFRCKSELKTISRRTLVMVVIAGVFLGLHFAAWITSLEYTSVASSVVLVTTAPLWVALLSPIFLKEGIGLPVFLGLAVSLTGSVIVGLNSACDLTDQGLHCMAFSNLFEGHAFWGNLLALAGAFLSAGYLMVGRSVRNGLSLLAYTSVVYGVAAIVLVILIVVTGVEIVPYQNKTWIWILLLALIPQILGHSTFNYFLKSLSAAYVSIALLGEPVGTVVLAFLFLYESPSLLEIGGGVLILAGIAIATLANQKLSVQNKPGGEHDIHPVAD